MRRDYCKINRVRGLTRRNRERARSMAGVALAFENDALAFLADDGNAQVSAFCINESAPALKRTALFLRDLPAMILPALDLAERPARHVLAKLIALHSAALAREQAV